MHYDSKRYYKEVKMSFKRTFKLTIFIIVVLIAVGIGVYLGVRFERLKIEERTKLEEEKGRIEDIINQVEKSIEIQKMRAEEKEFFYIRYEPVFKLSSELTKEARKYLKTDKLIRAESYANVSLTLAKIIKEFSVSDTTMR